MNDREQLVREAEELAKQFENDAKFAKATGKVISRSKVVDGQRKIIEEEPIYIFYEKRAALIRNLLSLLPKEGDSQKTLSIGGDYQVKLILVLGGNNIDDISITTQAVLNKVKTLTGFDKIKCMMEVVVGMPAHGYYEFRDQTTKEDK